MISKYPEFTEVDLSVQKELEAELSKYDSYSDFNFVSLFCWNADNSSAVSRLGDGLVIRLSDYLGNGQNYSYISNSKDSRKYIDIVLTTVKKLKFVPEHTVKLISDMTGLNIKEDLDNFDYIYSVSKLSTLEGGKLKKKRNKVNNFEKEMDEQTLIKHLDKITKQHKSEIEILFKKWCNENKKSFDSQKDEYAAVHRAIENLDQLGLIFTELRHNGELMGFSINQVLQDGSAVCHFEKTLNAHKNISPYLVREVAIMLNKKGCKYVNWEQDLGLEGLKQAKSSYKQEYFLKKYTISKSRNISN